MVIGQEMDDLSFDSSRRRIRGGAKSDHAQKLSAGQVGLGT